MKPSTASVFGLRSVLSVLFMNSNIEMLLGFIRAHCSSKNEFLFGDVGEDNVNTNLFTTFAVRGALMAIVNGALLASACARSLGAELMIESTTAMQSRSLVPKVQRIVIPVHQLEHSIVAYPQIVVCDLVLGV
jgi:hypothetical protein